MYDLLIGICMGSLVSAALAYSFREHIQVTTNDKLIADLKYADEEVKRLRAVMALHINGEQWHD